MSFYHHVENVMEVDYRWTINFDTIYTTWDGTTSHVPYGFYARRRDDGVVTNVEPMAQRLWSKGLYMGQRFDEKEGLRVIRSEDVFRETREVIEEGNARGHLYELA